jgi:hypothetical protein
MIFKVATAATQAVEYILSLSGVVAGRNEES